MITYTANGAQKVAVATGFTRSLANEVVTAKIVNSGPRQRHREPMTCSSERR